MKDKSNSGNTIVETIENSTNKVAKTRAKSKWKAQREKASPPPTAEMVNAAIRQLQSRTGTSLQAIQKYIAFTYYVDGEKFSPLIKKYLKAAVTSGVVIQTQGKGTFKLSIGRNSKTSKTKKVLHPAKKSIPQKAQSVEKKTVSRKPTPTKKPLIPKKTVTEKKPTAAKKSVAKAVVAKYKAATEAKNIPKSKRTTRALAAKTKTPKPKKAAASKAVKSSPKK